MATSSILWARAIEFQDNGTLDEQIWEAQCWACEQALWLDWMHMGSASCLVSCNLVSINPREFGRIMKNHDGAYRYAEELARCVENSAMSGNADDGPIDCQLLELAVMNAFQVLGTEESIWV